MWRRIAVCAAARGVSVAAAAQCGTALETQRVAAVFDALEDFRNRGVLVGFRW